MSEIETLLHFAAAIANFTQSFLIHIKIQKIKWNGNVFNVSRIIHSSKFNFASLCDVALVQMLQEYNLSYFVVY